jgi:hypothetical protein
MFRILKKEFNDGDVVSTRERYFARCDRGNAYVAMYDAIARALHDAYMQDLHVTITYDYLEKGSALIKYLDTKTWCSYQVVETNTNRS